MWFLISKQNEKITYLLANKKYKIGRFIEGQANDNDISIASDQSISRLHAELLMKYDENECTNIEAKPNIILTDHSKFGTFVNDTKVDGFRTLKPNDTIKFGVYKSIYQLRHEPLIVTTSCLTSVNKNLVKSLVCRLGGHLVNDWQNECSLVVMDAITVTVKVIDALICQKHIVTSDYLKEMVRTIEMGGEKLPDSKIFLPPIGEKNLEGKKQLTFEPLAVRKVLFKNKKFIFFDSVQLQKTQNIIELACGKCELFNSTNHLDLKTLKSNRDSFIFIQNNDNKSRSVKDNQLKLETLLKNLNQVLIDESDIGLAILFAELKEHCNPNKTTAERLVKDKLASQTLLDTYFVTDSIGVGFRSQIESREEDSQHNNSLLEYYVLENGCWKM